tara:strand:- start:213 stop:569 length:357 start_codon:yes stop_codon:yes gene_type:complete
MYYGIIFNDGNLSMSDFKKECQEESWLPLTVIRQEDKTMVPIFRNPETAHKFMKRNFNVREVLTGLLALTEEDITNAKDKGWEILELKWPNKYKDRAGHKIDVEIFEISSKPDVATYR